MTEISLMRCPACGATNRIASDKMNQRLAPVCGRCKTLLTAAAAPVIATDTNFAQTIAAAPRPVLLDLWAPWCGPCRQLTPVIEQLAQELAGRVTVAKLNVDENPATAARFGVQSIPTLLVLKQGQEVERLVGALPKQEILRRLQPVLAD